MARPMAPTSPPPDVSVVVAAYKAAGFIRPAIESALAQTGVTVEVVVVDDASPDDTGAVVRAIGDPRVVYDRLAANGGPSAARNRGFALARGRFIAVLDSDDALEPGRLARLVARAEQDGADIAIDNLLVVASDDDPGRPMFPPGILATMTRLTLPAFIRSNRLFAATFNYGYTKPVFRADFLRRAGVAYDPSLRIGEDYVFLADCLAAGAICAVEPSAGYRYLVRPGSISRVLTSADIRAMRRVDEDFLARHMLDAEALRAQAERTASLDDGEAFTNFVERAKKGDVVGAVGHLVRRPAAVRHLRMPIAARLKRFQLKRNRPLGKETLQS